MSAAELRDAVVAALAPVAEAVAAEGGARLDVRGSMHVRDAIGCAAAAALEGAEPFVASPAVAAWAVGSTLADRILHGHRDPGQGAAAADPQHAFAVAWRERGRLDDQWAWRWLADEATRGERAVTVAAASTKVAALARLLPRWPAPASHVGWRPGWSYPQRPLRLAGRADLVLGRRDGTHTLVVALGGDHGPAVRPRLAFEALVEALVLRRPPAAVLALLPDAGRRWSVAVDDALLREGIDAAVAAAATALGSRRADAAGLPRRPSSRCRRCPFAPGCEVGSAWLSGPGRLASGFVPAAKLPPGPGSD